jgi:hypothetical protein
MTQALYAHMNNKKIKNKLGVVKTIVSRNFIILPTEIVDSSLQEIEFKQ